MQRRAAVVEAPKPVNPVPVAREIVQEFADWVRPRIGTLERLVLDAKMKDVIRGLDDAEGSVDERMEIYEFLLRVHGKIERGLRLGPPPPTE